MEFKRACLCFWVKVCLQQSGCSQIWSAGREGFHFALSVWCHLWHGQIGLAGSSPQGLTSCLRYMQGHTSASPSRKNGQATMVTYIPAVDVDTDSSWGCIFVTTLMICIYLLIIDRAENIPVRKISQHFIFWDDPAFSFLLLCHLSANWDWNSQGLTSSANESILQVSDWIFVISEENLGKVACFVQYLKQK